MELPVTASSSDPGMADNFLHKNRLQEYAQKSAIALPLYHTVNEGHTHAPEFRSTVTIDGITVTSDHTFSHLKEAEQDVAKLALLHLSKKMKNESVSLINEDSIYCKSILYEYAVKAKATKPIYITSLIEGKFPTFVSKLTFDGLNYVGVPGKSKKEAEQMAARQAIGYILDNIDSRHVMSQIIKAKDKMFASSEFYPHKEPENVMLKSAGLHGGKRSNNGQGSPQFQKRRVV